MKRFFKIFKVRHIFMLVLCFLSIFCSVFSKEWLTVIWIINTSLWCFLDAKSSDDRDYYKDLYYSSFSSSKFS